ncbi:glycosyltransferase [Microbacterium stercoris]|uniref:Glycosyltransferase family 2 protein n=1 Tax=Microbacterium stercoris TaxID=2820289 RepID=A0A939TP56_9MICO|nr:glycosyltransferase [Microbacterium stercoris]MBO3662040.1 glycosyltransferase family 2 protein [Microbacterium stercoris]
MPPAVHAILVARATPEAAAQLERTLSALRAQERPVDHLTVVVCGSASKLRDLIDGSGAEGAIEAPASTSFAAAVRLGAVRVPEGRALWLLAHDTQPEPGTLAALSAALERAPSAAIAAPKLVDAQDPSVIVSLGVSMTRFGRTVALAGGEVDQGQHDGDDDVLGADVRGLLLRSDARAHLLPDPALAGADEGLDMGVRARLGGRRVALAPGARLQAPVAGMAGVSENRMAHAYAVRTAQLHRRLAYAPAWAVPLHWLTLLPLAVLRSFVHLVAKAPARVPAEWGAAVTVMVRMAAIARSRGEIRRFRTGPWSQIAPLRATAAQLREHSDPDGGEPVIRRELRFFSGGGAWAVLAALVISVAAFLPLLAWPVLGGGALLPMRETVLGLWADAAYGARATGLGAVGPADPFAAVVALLGSLSPARPALALVMLWLLALPFAVLGGWFAATRVSDRSGVRAAAAVIWALAPTFLTALVEGRAAAVLLHLLLPWLFFTASVAHRSWGASGAASILLLGVLACAPSLAPAIVLLWVLGLLLAIGFRIRRGLARVLWLIVPSAVVAVPLVQAQLERGTPWALLADPGRVWAGHEAAGPLLLASGFPTADPAGWGGALAWLGIADAPTAWVPFVLIPLALLALAAPLTPRWRAGAAGVVIAAAGLVTAHLAAGVQVSTSESQAVGVWPGSGLSLAWVGVVAAAAVTLDTGIRRRGLARLAAFAATACIVLLSVPSLTALARDEADIANGPASTLPAYVTARAADERDLGTLVLTAQPDGGVAARLVWGASETLGGQSTLQATDPVASDGDRRLAEIASDLVSASSGQVQDLLSEAGVRFVLLTATTDGPAETDAARTRRLDAITAVDQRPGFVRVGETAKGVLWRLDADPAPRPALDDRQQATARWILTTQAVALLVALLLAVPTFASRRDARRMPRVVGRGYEEADA